MAARLQHQYHLPINKSKKSPISRWTRYEGNTETTFKPFTKIKKRYGRRNENRLYLNKTSTSVVRNTLFALHGVPTTLGHRVVPIAVRRCPNERTVIQFLQGAPRVRTSGRLRNRETPVKTVTVFVDRAMLYYVRRRGMTTYHRQEADDAVRQRAAEDHCQHDFAPDETEQEISPHAGRLTAPGIFGVRTSGFGTKRLREPAGRVSDGKAVLFGDVSDGRIRSFESDTGFSTTIGRSVVVNAKWYKTFRLTRVASAAVGFFVDSSFENSEQTSRNDRYQRGEYR